MTTEPKPTPVGELYVLRLLQASSCFRETDGVPATCASPPCACAQSLLQEISRPLQAEIERLRAMLSWRPIETLPDSGVGMIIYLQPRNGKLSVGLGYRTVSGYWCDSESGFRRIDPTHWMPLPPPEAVR